MGPEFYFSRSAYDYDLGSLPHTDTDTALGFQVVLDIVVRNWDDGERNIAIVNNVPVFFDYGASLDPACQNIYRFLLKLDEARKVNRVSSIISYFTAYSSRRSNILKKAIRVFQAIPLWEIRSIVNTSGAEVPGFFGEYLAKNLFNLAEEVDILRGAFLRLPPEDSGSRKSTDEAELYLKETYFRQVK